MSTFLCMTQPPTLLTVPEVVERLKGLGIRVAPETVRNWARRKMLRHTILPSGRYMFRPADVDAVADPAPERVA